MACRILLVDPCPVVHAGIAAIVNGTDFQVAHVTGSLSAALHWLSAEQPNIILCELELEDGNSRELALAAHRMDVPLVLFTSWENPVFLSRMFEAGAWGLIDKSSTDDEILAKLQMIANGKRTWQRVDVRKFTGAMATPRLENHIQFPLTQREFEVLGQLAIGQTNKMIAENMDISYETVKEHVQNILLKLGVADRTQAAVMAVRQGLL